MKIIYVYIFTLAVIVGILGHAYCATDRDMLQERAQRVQTEYNLGKTMMQKAELEWQQIQQQIQMLDSMPTSTLVTKPTSTSKK